MRRTYVVLACGIVLLGAVHMFATLRIFDALTARALWFFSGGVAIALTGALNLLNHAYGDVAPGVRRVCVATNVLMTAFGITSALVMRAGAVAFLVVVSLIGGVTVLSLFTRARPALPAPSSPHTPRTNRHT